jgi:D-sedoheptulose 7-phosphate isomerase
VDIGTPDSYRSAAAVMKNVIDDANRPQAAEQAETARRHLELSAVVARQVMEQCIPDIVRAAEVIAESFAAGGTVLLCGNGGSAADAQHVAAEFVNRLRKEVERRALPALALTTDTSFLSAYANDYDWDGVFARQVEALGKEGDVLVAISTSGNSRNVLRAVETARERGLRTVALVGQAGALADLCDTAVVIPSTNTGAIQESMLAVEHTICELVEDALFGRPHTKDGDAH